MCDLTLSNRWAAVLSRGLRPVSAVADTPPLPLASTPLPDPVAALEARLDAQQGQWSSRRVRAALFEQQAHGPRG